MITKYLKIKDHIYTESDSRLMIKGANWGEAGSALTLYTPQYSSTTVQGGFDLSTDLGNNIGNYKLKGRTNGSLTWNNNDLAGAAIAVKNLATNGYIKYASELLIQWGRIFIPVNTNNANNILPISFNSKAIGVGNIAYVDGNESSTVRAINIDVLFNNKTIKTVLESVEHTGDVYVNYITIGY